MGEGTSRGGPAHRAALLGAMYVVEGSTLGGQYIARHVEAVLGLAPGQGDAYFRGHREKTGSLWREILAEIAAVPDEEASEVIETARRVFGVFGRCLQLGYAVEGRT